MLKTQKDYQGAEKLKEVNAIDIICQQNEEINKNKSFSNTV